MSAVLADPPLDTLCALFTGDELTDGYPTLALALAVCRAGRPTSAIHLKQILYGQLPMDDIPLHVRETLARAYVEWVRGQRR